MIEREFIRNKVKSLNIKEKIESITPNNAGIGNIIIEKTPISETITIDAIKPGLIIGRRGETIKTITDKIKQQYKLENPQIKVREIAKPNLCAGAVAKKIVSDFERFGSTRYKSIGHKTVTNIIQAGALGVEIILSGKLPSKRARSWRFYDGYMKKCGQIADIYVDTAIESAVLPSGVIGIKVRILRKDVPLPDKITIIEPKEIVEEKAEIAVKPAEETETKEEAIKAMEKAERKEEAAIAIIKPIKKKSEKKTAEKTVKEKTEKKPAKEVTKKKAKKVISKKETKKK